METLPKRLFTDEGGSIGLVRVAGGAVHAMIEFAKGFAPHDLLTGYFIAKKAGAYITQLDGTPLITHPHAERQKFIAACDPILFQEIRSLLSAEYPLRILQREKAYSNELELAQQMSF